MIINKKAVKVFSDSHSEIVKAMPFWISQTKNHIVKYRHDFGDLHFIWTFRDEEIESEIVQECLRRASIFKGGSFVAYCSEYVPQEAARRLSKQLAKMSREIPFSAITPEGYEDTAENYVESHVVSNWMWDAGKVRGPDRWTSSNDGVDVLLENADEADRKAMYLVLGGASIREAAEKVGVDHATLLRRFAKYRKALRK